MKTEIRLSERLSGPIKWALRSFLPPLYLLTLSLTLSIPFLSPLRAAEGTLVRLNNIAKTVSSPLVQSVPPGTNNIVTLFSLNTAEFDGRTILRTVQNTGICPVLYSINTTNVSTTNYHGILACGSAARDGLGSVLDLSNIPFPVSFYTETATGVLAVVELTQ